MKKILVVFGGRSAEHDVSIVTAHIPIMEALQAVGDYDIYPLYITGDGSWYCQKEFIKLSYFQQPDWREQIKRLPKVQLDVNNGLTIVWPGLRAKKAKIDIVFPSMHGTYGEDGSLMGLLRMANVPFVGCDMAASAVAMDKVLTKQVCEAAGLAVVPYVWFTDAEWQADKKAVEDRIGKLTYPLFIKPVHLGSSIGISRIEKKDELENALEVGLHYDDKVLVEEAVPNHIEVTLPIMGNESPRPALLERPTAGLFTYEEKYLKDGGKKGTSGVNTAYSEIPAKLDETIYSKCVDLGLAAYRVLGCSGIARVDMLINGSTHKPYVNEINTLPGSLYAHNWRAAGVSQVELVTELIRLAEELHKQAEQKTFVFESDILTHVKGGKVQS